LTERVAADLMQIGSVTEFVAEMRRLKNGSGLGYQQLEDRAQRIGLSLPHSTLATALTRDALPRHDLVEAFVRACGGDDDNVAWWLKLHAKLASVDPLSPTVRQGAEPESGPEPGPASAADAPPAPVAAVPRGRRRWLVGAVAVIVAALTFGGGAAVAKMVDDPGHSRRDQAMAASLSPSVFSAAHSSVPAPHASGSPTPSSSPATAAVVGWFRIRPVLTYQSKFCVIIRDSGDKIVLEQAACSTSTELHFRLETSGGPTTVRIRPRSARMGTNSCVSVNDTGSFAGVYLRNCGDLHAVQVFVLERTRSTNETGPMYRFRPSAHPARCLGVAGRSTKSGTAITEQDCNGTPSQEFALEVGSSIQPTTSPARMP
jgi:hypothetical protein